MRTIVVPKLPAFIILSSSLGLLITAMTARIPANGMTLHSLLEQLPQELTYLDTDRRFRTIQPAFPYKRPTSIFDLSPVGPKRGYVGLDFPDYVTDEERKANANSNSGEGGRRRYLKTG